jgi:hypothetical protein
VNSDRFTDILKWTRDRKQRTPDALMPAGVYFCNYQTFPETWDCRIQIQVGTTQVRAYHLIRQVATLGEEPLRSDPDRIVVVVVDNMDPNPRMDFILGTCQSEAWYFNSRLYQVNDGEVSLGSSVVLDPWMPGNPMHALYDALQWGLHAPGDQYARTASKYSVRYLEDVEPGLSLSGEASYIDRVTLPPLIGGPMYSGTD